MKIREVMIRDVQAVPPDETVQAAAQIMADLNAGALPVGTGGSLQGILTSRDIIIRLVAAGRDPAATRVRDIMSSDVVSCREDASVEEVRREMAERQVRRMPVLDADRRLAGMVSLDDLAGAARGEAKPD